MELSDKEKGIFNDLVNIAWQAGAIKAPQMAQEVENLRAKVLAKPAPEPEKKK